MTHAELVALVCCDLGGIVRGRSVLATELEEHLEAGIGWVPANHALTPLGGLADGSPFGSTGDLRLLPDPDTRVRIERDGDFGPLEALLCDLVELDGSPWECCPREFLRAAVGELERETGTTVLASFEHEFQLRLETQPALPFSLEAQRRVEPFPVRLMGALADAGLHPERFFAEYASHQFEIPIAPAGALAAADRAVLLREIVREIARRLGMQATFVPLLDPDEAGNGVHVHIDLIAGDGSPALYDAGAPGGLSELGGRLAAGILLHARALTALTAPSPVSGARLQPHRWSAGAACLGDRNRETLLRIPPLPRLGGAAERAHAHLEYRGADAAANPYLLLGGVLRAGLDGVRCELAPAPILDRDPSVLEGEEAERFGVGALPSTLEESLAALSEDEQARGWMSPLMLEAYSSVKRSEIVGMARLDLGEICRRYAAIY